MANSEICPHGIKNEGRILALENDMSEVKVAITDIRDRLLGRPSWVVLAFFTAMSSTIVGLLLTLMNK